MVIVVLRLELDGSTLTLMGMSHIRELIVGAPAGQEWGLVKVIHAPGTNQDAVAKEILEWKFEHKKLSVVEGRRYD